MIKIYWPSEIKLKSLNPRDEVLEIKYYLHNYILTWLVCLFVIINLPVFEFK